MEIIKTIVEGGKATAGPPLGPKLGPLGVNIGGIVSKINEKTQSMKGIDVPVIVKVDPKTKEFEIEVGTPSSASLIKKELKITSGAGNQTLPVADMSIDRAIKIAKIKVEGLLAANLKSATKEILGTCVSMGILIEGKDAREIQKEVDEGKYDEKINGNKELIFWDDAKLNKRRKELEKVIKALQEKKEEATEEGETATPEEAEKDKKETKEIKKK